LKKRKRKHKLFRNGRIILQKGAKKAKETTTKRGKDRHAREETPLGGRRKKGGNPASSEGKKLTKNVAGGRKTKAARRGEKTREGKTSSGVE